MRPQTCLLLAACLAAAASKMPLRAQTAPVGAFRTEAEAARHQAGFLAAAQKQGYTSRPTFFYRNRLDVTKTQALRREGVDLLQMDRRILIDGSYGYREQTLFADWVVRGIVLEETGDSSRRVCFHTTYKIKVMEVWQGQLSSATISVKTANGPVGSFRLHVAESPDFHLGQEVVLYLNRFDLAGFAEAEKQGFTTCASNATPEDFQVSKVLQVQPNGYVAGDAGLPVAKVRAAVQAISAVLDKEHFYQKAF
ncbi:hypothetical protein [Hymenobacter armeniacus]|uniref:DUF4468 domain-containing protein n=1 Tax=Hymenobacter armeniacus TaxID=2771358 RepID=A0ABR8K203_9BACT|nr:hypothetical protein [Hymenobacter armeniacus]MBD2724524.1 hypothetical protein [Hymenobacter armeniacus]